jgi:hypothetical protein
MKNLFIDSNIWLKLYDFSSDDLNQFMKLKDLIGVDINIILPEQVVDEVNRNRESKIKDALSKFEKWELQIPNFCKGYVQYSAFQKKVSDLQKAHREYVQQIKKDIGSKTLHADKAINLFFGQITILQRTPEIVAKAYHRYRIGNPPGKDNKYGDSINWTTLLDKISDNEDLFFISADGDYQSVLDKEKFNQFLLDEWREKKKSDIFFFRSLTEFFERHVKAIQLKDELIADKRKNSLISELECSSSFANTHGIVSQLSKFSTWNDEQVNRILDAVEDNSQVGAICGDDDIAEFLESLPSVQRKRIENDSEISIF